MLQMWYFNSFFLEVKSNLRSALFWVSKQRAVVVSYLRSGTNFSLKMRPISCTEKSVRNTSEERRSRILRGGSQKSREVRLAGEKRIILVKRCFFTKEVQLLTEWHILQTCSTLTLQEWFAFVLTVMNRVKRTKVFVLTFQTDFSFHTLAHLWD